MLYYIALDRALSRLNQCIQYKDNIQILIIPTNKNDLKHIQLKYKTKNVVYTVHIYELIMQA